MNTRQSLFATVRFIRTIRQMLIVAAACSYAYGTAAAPLSFSITIDPATRAKFTPDEARATLSSSDVTTSVVIPVNGGKVTGDFLDLPPGDYTLVIELTDNGTMVGSGSATGSILFDTVVQSGARTLDAGDKTLVIVDWDVTNTVTTDDFHDFSIEPNQPRLKRYDLKNIDTIGKEYLESGMLFFSGVGVKWDWLDENMTPWLVTETGNYRVPVSICHTAFGFHRYYRETNRKDYYQYFLNNVNWLVENHDENYYLYHHLEKTHAPGAFLADPWVSAMAQGEALAAVCMAWQLTGEQIYYDTAEGFFRTMHTNIEPFWTVGIDAEDYYWTEEFPNKDFCHVLNGMLFALWGLWDYYLISGNELSLELFTAGIRSIADHYPDWNIDGENGSMYCSHFVYTHQTYHPIHLTLFEKYLEHFDIPEFRHAILLFKNEYKTSVDTPDTPVTFELSPNFPNPFNSSTTLRFGLPEETHTSLAIYSLSGQRIRTLSDAVMPPGIHAVIWDGADDAGEPAASGVYIGRLQAGTATLTRKITLMK